MENKLQVFSKFVVTYECNMKTQKLCHYVRHKLKNRLLGKFFSLLPCNKIQGMKDNDCFTVT